MIWHLTAINDFSAKLDEEKRNMFVRRYWFLIAADIAKRCGISESKVKNNAGSAAATGQRSI